MKKHLIIASYDGITSYYCGIGTTMQDTVSSLKSILAEDRDGNLKVSLAFPYAHPGSAVFNETVYSQAQDLVTSSGGSLLSLSNGMRGKTEYDMWGSFDNWKILCNSLVSVLNTALDPNEENILMLHDTPYLLFSKYKSQLKDLGLKIFYMPRSTGSNHDLGDQNWRKERIEIEKECFHLIENQPDSKILSIGYNFGEHLKLDYEINLDPSQYFINGLDFNRYHPFMQGESDFKEIASLLGDDICELTESSKVIFSWGRASIAKGLKELILSWETIHSEFEDYYLVIQAPNNSGEDGYFSELQQLSQKASRVIVINSFNPTIWHSFLRYNMTKVVSIPSLMDPIPHTAIEAKLFQEKGEYSIVCSDVDGVVDVFTNGNKECFWGDPRQYDEFGLALKNAICVNKNSLQNMIDSNINSLDKFNYIKTFRTFLGINIVKNKL